MRKTQTIVVHLLKIRRRTPIKPVQTHKSDVKYTRKIKHRKDNDVF
jgi:hypothetical protein